MNRTLLRGAQVITMAAGRPDSERADILITGDVISAIGTDIGKPDAEVIDLSGRVIIPGLINAHLHTWQTALLGIGSNWTLFEYLAQMHGPLARAYQPEDIYIGTLAGALGQIDCGTTTIGDWSHNNRTPDHATAAVTALQDSGIRGVFLYAPAGYTADVAHPVTETERLIAETRNPLVTVGMAVPGPQISTEDIAVADLRAAAERDLVASMHYSLGQPTRAWQIVRDAGLLGEHVNIVHGTGLTDEWISTLVDTGATFTVTPENELGQGHGHPIVAELHANGTAPSLGTDTESVVPGDVLTAARVALALQRGADHDLARRTTGVMSPTTAITAKRALSWATTEGARALGLADRVGCLLPGMQADVCVIDARRMNLWPIHDPVAAALHANLANIEAVMVGGNWRKRDHRLVGVDLDRVRDRLHVSSQRIIPVF